MARQKGVIKLQGQMGGVSFYKSQQDGFLAREKGGVDADRIKNDPNFERPVKTVQSSDVPLPAVATDSLRTLVNIADSRMTVG
jgi:hypothetical protein